MKRIARTTALWGAILGLLLTYAPEAAAQGPAGNPLVPLAPQAPSTPTTTAPPIIAPSPTTASPGGGLNGTDGVAIGIGALVVLGGISFFIWRDARRRAPVRGRPATAAAGGGAGPRQRPKRKLSPQERRRRKRGRAR